MQENPGTSTSDNTSETVSRETEDVNSAQDEGNCTDNFIETVENSGTGAHSKGIEHLKFSEIEQKGQCCIICKKEKRKGKSHLVKLIASNSKKTTILQAMQQS